MDNLLELIMSRRSVRSFKNTKISLDVVKNILEAARWAPSGLNNQPWRFLVLEGKEKDNLASYTHYGNIIKSADKIILVFLDKESSYNYEKDLMAIGACIQNMLLYIHSIGLGACWLGEILNRRDEIKTVLGLKENLELEAVIAVGEPASYPKIVKRKKIEQLLVK